MQNKDNVINTVLRLCENEALRKIVFSKPLCSEIKKISARLVSHRGRRMIAFELSLPGDTVSQRNVGEDTLAEALSEYIDGYSQINIL